VFGIASFVITWVCGEVTTEGAVVVCAITGVFDEVMVFDETHIG